MGRCQPPARTDAQRVKSVMQVLRISYNLRGSFIAYLGGGCHKGELIILCTAYVINVLGIADYNDPLVEM